jgi:transcriptional regulator with XRE-family HTH domain
MDKETEKLAVELGKRIRQQRTKAGYSQVTFSEMTGLTQGFISRLESGQVELCLGSLRAISDALGMPLGGLFKGL